MTTQHTSSTPVTDMVRQHEGDYLAACRDMDEERNALLAAAESALEAIESLVNQDPGDWFEVEMQLRAAIKLAKEGAPT